MSRSTTFRLLTLLLLHQQLAGYPSSQFDSSSLPTLPTVTSASASTVRDVIQFRGDGSRDCHPTVPGCVCFRAIADDESTSGPVADDLITGETISNSSTRSDSDPTEEWECVPLSGSSKLSSTIDGMPASPVELSLYFGVAGENSSRQDVANGTSIGQALCQLRNVRHLTVSGLNDDPSAKMATATGRDLSDVIRPMVECFEELDRLTVKHSSIVTASELLDRWIQRLQSTMDTANGSATLNSRRNPTHLDLSDNMIQSFDINLVTSSISGLEELDLSGNQLTNLVNMNCTASSMSEPAESNNTGSGSQPTGKTSSPDNRGTVKGETGNGSCIRPGVSDEFPAVALWSLNASRNMINSIDAGLFNFRFRNLVVLDLSYNSLTSLANGTFADLYSLRTVNLSHNSIDDVDIEAFTTTLIPTTGYDNETNGGRLNFRGSGKTADREEQYYIRLASCTSGWLDIQVVDLSHNHLTSLREGALELALCAVRHLLLSYNRLDRLPRYVFEHLPYLQTLDLANNQLAWLDVGAFTNPSLASLDLSGNRLRKIVSMTFLYLPAIRRIDLARNEISYIYKFAFYRMCSPNDDGSMIAGTGSTSTGHHGRRLAIVLRSNRLGSDAIWKMLTTFEHLESPGCLVDVDLQDNQIERFLPAEPLDFVLKRLEETSSMSDSQLALSTSMQHFRRWDHVTIDLAENTLRCDCSLVNELNAIDDVIRIITNSSSTAAAGHEVITESWHRLNCSSPEELRGVTVLEFATELSKTRCQLTKSSMEAKFCSSYCTCVKNVDDSAKNGSIVMMNCSGRHMAEFKLFASSSSSSAVFRRVHTLDLSKNSLVRIDPELLRRWFPALRVLYLHDNKMTSLPLVDGTYGHIPILVTIAGNPLSCANCDSSTPIAATNRYNIVDWNRVTCSDDRHPTYVTTSGHACAMSMKSLRTVSSRPIGVLSSSMDESATVPRAMMIVGLTLAIVLVLLLIVTLIGLATWSTEGLGWARGGRFRHRIRDDVCGRGWFRLSGGCPTKARLGDVRLEQTDAIGSRISGFAIDDGLAIGNGGDQELFITYCGADSEWVASHLLPVVRRCRSSFVTVRLQSFDSLIEVESRQFLGDFRQNLDECCSSVVVVSRNFVDAVIDSGKSKPPEVLQLLDVHCRKTTGRCIFLLIDAVHNTVDTDDSGPLGLVHGLTTGNGSTSCLIFAATDDGGRSFSERLRYHLLLQKRHRQKPEQPRWKSTWTTFSGQVFVNGFEELRRWWRYRVCCDVTLDDSRIAVVDANEKLMSVSTATERY